MGFPEQLKKARIAMGYTQRQVADMMGITTSTYCGYETGKRQPDITKLKQLADILQTNGNFFLETGSENPMPNASRETLPPKYLRLNADAKKIVDTLIVQLLAMQEKTIEHN